MSKKGVVEGVCFHTLRRTAVSRMVAAGVPDRIIMRVVGHSTANMVTRDAHLAPDSLKGATDCLWYKDGTKHSPGTGVRGKLPSASTSR